MKKEYDSQLKKQVNYLLKNIFVFSGVCEDRIVELTEPMSFEVEEFRTGDIIYSPNRFRNKVGFVLSGECMVERIKNDGSSIPLNTLFKNDTFGILAVFSCDEKFPTFIRAKKTSEILFITKEDILNLIKLEPLVALNMINFMSGRISFLNDKIATFSADSIEQKLANYLLLEKKKHNAMSFSFNCKKTAETINAGRASLYRALDSLSEKNIIKLENKKIYISDLESLERISK